MLDLGTLVGYLKLDDQQFDKTLDAMPGKLKLSGPGAKMAAGALAALIGVAIGTGIAKGIELDTARAKISAELGLTETESARIGGVAGTLYAQAYGDSIEEVNTAVATVVSSIDGMRDATAEALEDMTARAINFANGFELDVGRATQVVGQMVKSGLVADAKEGFDILTATMQQVPKALREDILDAADEYGPFFQSIGLEGGDAFGLLASQADRGMYGIDKAGDAVKEFTIRATDLGDTGAQEALEGLGLSGQDMANDLLAGGDDAAAAFDTIVSGLQGIKDPAAQAAAATALFGTPLEDLGKDQIPGFLSALTDAKDGLGETEGAADRMGETLNGDVATGWTQVSRTWNGIVGQIGQALVPMLGTIGDILTEHPALLQVMAAIIGVLAVAFIGLTVATWAMNTALLANPITWIVLAIVALIAALILLIMNWDSVVAFIKDIWGAAVAWVASSIKKLLGFMAGIPAAIMGFFTGIGAWLVSVGSTLINGMLTGVRNGWNGFIGFLRSIPGAVVGFFSGIGSWLFNAGKDLISGLLNGIKSLAGTIGNFFLGLLPGWIVGPFKAALGIASPSKVFRGYGRNIVQGLVLGADDEQSALDARMGNLVSVPSSSAATGRRGAADGTGSAGRSGSSTLIINGNVGWDAEEVARRNAEKQRQAAALAGLDDLVGVA